MTSRRHLSPAKALTASSKQIDEELVLIDEERKIVVRDSTLLEHAVNDCYEHLLESVMLGFAFEMHRNLKVGMCEYDNVVPRNVDQDIVDSPGLDIFGLPPLKKPPDCTCPHCNRRLTAVRFAPHLEKCRGFGRNSSRSSRRQTENTTNSESTKAKVGHDADWTVESVKQGKKKERAPGKRKKNTKVPMNDHSNHAEASKPVNVTIDLSVSNNKISCEEGQSLLVHRGGVISKHTPCLCIQSLQCPQDTDDQLQAVPMLFFNSEVSAEDSISFEQVDVDTYEEGDGQNIRDQLGQSWEYENFQMNSSEESRFAGSFMQLKTQEKLKKKNKSSQEASHHSYDD